MDPRHNSRLAALVLAAGFGLGAGCLLEFERGLSCGDGWIDPAFEECDPKDPKLRHLSACRDQGWMMDASCDPQTCQILDSEEHCNVCGDGVAASTEECDGNDLKGQTCSAGAGLLRCNDNCRLDHTDCPAVCGDGELSGNEECEPQLACASDEDCPEGWLCYEPTNQCVFTDGFAPIVACAAYETTASGIPKKPYASGTIGACATSGCRFSRVGCSFCGDGELDGEYSDIVQDGSTQPFLAEVCDGKLADPEELSAYCEPLCLSDQDPPNADVVVLCDFECNPACTGFSPPVDIVPSPDAIGCCLAKGSPCPNFDTTGVPEFPCCSWKTNEEWAEEMKCVASQTGQVPVTQVCP